VRLLKDDELIPLVTRANPIIRNIPPPAGGDWYGEGSPVQASSVDLHIGNIYLPGTKRNETGSEAKPLEQHILKPGHTAVLTSLEKLELPGNIAGIGFPPSRVSFKGILMTNPGHIDPGYAGHMRFTVINMSKVDYVLERQKLIATVLLFELDTSAANNWLQRQTPNVGEPSTQDNLDRLSVDFMDFNMRATRIAENAVSKAELKIKYWQVGVPIIVALITALGTLWFSWVKPTWREPVEEIKRDISVLRASLDLRDIKGRLVEVERLLKGTKQAPGSDVRKQGARP